ncbi:MAG: hypothetical protein LBB47_03140 [Spirochaetaceae bacterium]|nr:hypothetical protein [Spirochaetaceae bacterium]
MLGKRNILYLFMAVNISLSAQTYTAVSLDSHIYNILEQAEMRGLCPPLSGVKPYTRFYILSAINTILSSENKSAALNITEKTILENYRDNFGRPASGLNKQKGYFYTETNTGKNDTRLSAYAGASAVVELSDGVYLPSNDNYFGNDLWVSLFIKGDIGRRFSYNFSAAGGLVKSPRKTLGKYNTYYEYFVDDDEYKNLLINSYSQPLAYFPYTYQKKWDGSVYFLDNLYDFDPWPNSMAGVYNLKSEIGGVFLDSKIKWRFGRLEHEWGNSSLGSSLSMNLQARPFLGAEASFTPLDWFGISSLTGILEYYNDNGIKVSAMTNQNAFSISMLEFKYKNYFYFDLGEAVVWTKRFELGYISPITNHIFYQNNIGDFDNMSMFFNLKGQYPGLGKIWFSLFWDEAYWLKEAFELDRTMISTQAGTVIYLPVLAFSSIKLTYTKIEPYCYTHNRNFVPGYTQPMETAYTNNGVGIGYYLPPNSDELLLRFETMAGRALGIHFQYQMIRHGADFGPNAVDGSSYLSELDPNGRNEKKELKKYFLHDGAYQWFHVLKAGAEYTLGNPSVKVYGEAGVVFSYFTNIDDGKANQGESLPYRIVDEEPYFKSTAVIMTIGIKLFPDI